MRIFKFIKRGEDTEFAKITRDNGFKFNDSIAGLKNAKNHAKKKKYDFIVETYTGDIPNSPRIYGEVINIFATWAENS